MKDFNHLEAVLKVLQHISLEKSLAETAVQHESLLKEFLPNIKQTQPALRINSLRTVFYLIKEKQYLFLKKIIQYLNS